VIILPTKIGAEGFSPDATFLGKTKDQLMAEAIARHTLEQAALKLEAMAGADAYVRAWQKAARVLREMKPDP
jgi:hypothetical protein